MDRITLQNEDELSSLHINPCGVNLHFCTFNPGTCSPTIKQPKNQLLPEHLVR